MVALDGLGAVVQVLERVAVRGQHLLHAADLADPVERVEEQLERILARREARDVGRDRRQHVVARDEYALVGVVQAEVIHRVAGRVVHVELASGQQQHVAVLDGV